MRRVIPPSAPALAAALALALATACAQDASAPSSDFATTFDTIAGIVHVTNAGDAPPARLVPVVSIGPKTLTDTGSPDEFGGVTSVALGPAGDVFVADGRNFEVRVFGLDGAHRRTFGREGEGPGEFRSIYSLAWAGDRLLTFDPPQGRIGEWSAEGDWLGQQRTQGGVTGPSAVVRLFPVGPDELFRSAIGDRIDTPRGPALRSLYVGLDSRGATGDTLVLLRPPADVPPSHIICQSERTIGYFTIPFAPQFVQHPGPGGAIYSALTNAYRISVTRNDGADTLRVIQRELVPEPIGDEEWASGTAELDEWQAEQQGASCEPSGPTRPASKPFIEDLFIAPDGRLWVEVIRTGGNRWEVFDPEGRLLGGAAAPPRRDNVVPAFGPSDYLLTVRRDSLDLDHVDVWRFDLQR